MTGRWRIGLRREELKVTTSAYERAKQAAEAKAKAAAQRPAKI